MNHVLLGLAVTAAVAAPASAQTRSSTAIASSVGQGFAGKPVSRARIVPRLGNHRRHIHVRGPMFAGAFGYEPGYYDYCDYDANRSFDPDKWNDWWNERPEHAFPRWVWHNQNCTEDRMWWSGAGWRCVP